MINNELAGAFERIGDLLEITGADRFRINSYRRAGRTVKNCVEDLEVVAAEGRLGKLPGIGKSTASKITQYIETGHIDLLDELSAKLPAGLPALLDVPGSGGWLRCFRSIRLWLVDTDAGNRQDRFALLFAERARPVCADHGNTLGIALKKEVPFPAERRNRLTCPKVELQVGAGWRGGAHVEMERADHVAWSQ
ncbi:MAG: hypothetical protein GY778_24795 [bacterium]|nr:hypothetical protein [bacterium]